MESLSAHDEFGIALIQFDHDAHQALAEFNRAVELAPEGLNECDAEWAELHWHRAVAEQQLQRNIDAYSDFAVAERSFAIAAKTNHIYQDFLVQIVRQHASMLEKDGKPDQAETLLKTLGHA